MDGWDGDGWDGEGVREKYNMYTVPLWQHAFVCLPCMESGRS